MTTKDVYETVHSLLNHMRNDLIEDSITSHERQLVTQVSAELIDMFEDDEDFIVTFTINKPGFKDEHGFHTETNLVEPDDCEELVHSVYLNLTRHGSKIIEEISL